MTMIDDQRDGSNLAFRRISSMIGGFWLPVLQSYGFLTDLRPPDVLAYVLPDQIPIYGSGTSRFDPTVP